MGLLGLKLICRSPPFVGVIISFYGIRLRDTPLASELVTKIRSLSIRPQTRVDFAFLLWLTVDLITSPCLVQLTPMVFASQLYSSECDRTSHFHDSWHPRFVTFNIWHPFVAPFADLSSTRLYIFTRSSDGYA